MYEYACAYVRMHTCVCDVYGCIWFGLRNINLDHNLYITKNHPCPALALNRRSTVGFHVRPGVGILCNLEFVLPGFEVDGLTVGSVPAFAILGLDLCVRLCMEESRVCVLGSGLLAFAYGI